MGFTFYTHPEVEFFLLKDLPDRRQRRPSPADTGGYFDLSTHDVAHDFRREAVFALEAHGHLGGVQPPRGRARPAGDRPALRRRAVDGRQHHDAAARGPGGRARRRACTPPSCPSRSPTWPARRCTPTCRCSRATATPSTTPPTRCGCRRPASSSSPACSTHAREITAVTNQSVNSYRRLLAGTEAPTAATWGRANRSALVRVPSYKPSKAQLGPGRGALAGLRLQPVPGLRRAAGRRAAGHREGLRAAARGRGRRLVADRHRAARGRATRTCRCPSARR